MALNDLKKPLRNHRYYKLKFRDKRDAQRSIGGMWNPFFFHTCRGDPWPDLAIWEIGSEIRLRPASTELDEEHPRFQRPAEACFISRPSTIWPLVRLASSYGNPVRKKAKGNRTILHMPAISGMRFQKDFPLCPDFT